MFRSRNPKHYSNSHNQNSSNLLSPSLLFYSMVFFFPDMGAMSRYILLITAALLVVGAHGNDETRQEIQRYKQLSKIVNGMLSSENCPDPDSFVKRADLALGTSDIELEAQKILYEKLTNRLIECRKQKLQTSPATTTAYVPDYPIIQCEKAINLTESWRQDHSGSKSKPVNGEWNCDPKAMAAIGRPWFRFSGPAGDHLLDKCIPYNSCGTEQPIWTDAVMPTSVGVETPVTVYTAFGRYCKWWTRKISVVRCTNVANDFVYRYDDENVDCRIPLGFCGTST